MTHKTVLKAHKNYRQRSIFKVVFCLFVENVWSVFNYSKMRLKDHQSNKCRMCVCHLDFLIAWKSLTFKIFEVILKIGKDLNHSLVVMFCLQKKKYEAFPSDFILNVEFNNLLILCIF